MPQNPFAVLFATLLAIPAQADIDPGAYLAGRHAGMEANFASAAPYFRSAMMSDPQNTLLMEQALTSYLGAGEVETAALIAHSFLNTGNEAQSASIAIMAKAARDGEWPSIFDQLEAGHVVGPLIDGLAQGWAAYGMGDTDDALSQFDALIETQGLRSFGQQHKALLLEMEGQFEAANAIYDLPPNEGIAPTRSSVIFHLSLLTKQGAFDRAREVFDRAFSGDPAPDLRLLDAAITNQTVADLPAAITSPAAGLSLGFQTLSEALDGDASDAYLLLYAQAARHIDPENAFAHMAAARFQTALSQYDASAQTFARVQPDHTAFYDAELGRAGALRQAGHLEQAIEVLTNLANNYPNLPHAHVSLGDIHQQTEDYTQANAAYDTALQITEEGSPVEWLLYYRRAVTFERLDQWGAAEADFRQSLALNPDNATVLNYLGYSLVDRGLKYDEALGMIEQAVAARPDSGAITDSLAWVYYKLGRYEDAVAPMERAAELEPNDPILSDHLGDVYWMVDRKVEAHFQWRRALSFEPEEDEAVRIREKLRIGLDAVYEAEGVTPAPAIVTTVAD